MRSIIRDRLIAEVEAVAGRVYDVEPASAGGDKPYLVLLQGEETRAERWVGYRTMFEVKPYVATTSSFADVDELGQAVIAALHGQTLTDPDTGGPDEQPAFTCYYVGTPGKDELDTGREALTRAYRFDVYAVHPAAVAVEPSAEEDGWLAALRNWTEAAMGPEWTVYRGSWPTDYARPCVLWRLAAVEIGPGNRAAFEVRKKLTAHVLAQTPEAQDGGAMALFQKLNEQPKLPLVVPQRRYMTVREASADFAKDGMADGQIRVTLSGKIAKSQPASPLMQQVYFRNSIQMR